MGKFDVGVTDILDRTIEYELYLNGREEPIVAHLKYAGVENKKFAAAFRAAILPHQQRIQRKRSEEPIIHGKVLRRLFPGRALVRATNVPLKGGGVTDVDAPEELAELCQELPETYFQELLEAASTLANFAAEDEPSVTADEAREVAESLGEGSSKSPPAKGG